MAWVAVVLSLVGVGSVLAFDLSGFQSGFRSTGDVTSLSTEPPYLGFLSQAGVVVWTIGATVALWTVIVGVAERSRRRLLLSGGVLTTLLMLDDLYLLHDVVLPVVTGIPEHVFLGLNGLACMLFVAVNWTAILGTPWLFLAVAVGFLALMIGFDLVEHEVEFAHQHLLEEGAKFVGIVFWSLYFVTTSLQVTRSAETVRAAGAADPSAPVR